jgi:RNA polymerase sigma-70 factor (ECF subfamily)
MGADRFGGRTHLLTVEAGRDRDSGSFTVHEQVVDSCVPEVPQYRRPAVDDLTRLAIAARDGDRLALGAFVRQSQGDVWRLVAHLTDPSEADDVTQDVYVRAWRALPAYRADASARTWLFAIARRACADSLRTRGRRRRLAARIEDAASTADPTSPDGSGAHALNALITDLGPDRREAFVLTQVLGTSYEEAAGICGVPVGTIRSRVARARAELIEALRAAEATG